ncbi:MAG: MFS transporter [Kiritimatiellales bacterium]
MRMKQLKSGDLKFATAAALLSLFVFAFASNALPVVLLRAADALQVHAGTLAQVAAFQFCGYLLAAVVCGILADYIGKKAVLSAAGILLLAGAGSWTASVNLNMAITGGILMGMGGGVIESMSTTVLSDLYPERRRFFMNLSQIVFCAGAIAGPALMSWLLPLGMSWRIYFIGVAIISALLTVLFTCTKLPAPAQDERIHPAALGIIAKRKSFLLPCCALFFSVLTEACIIIYANAYLQTVHHAPEHRAISFLSIFWLSMLLGRWACAAIPERIPHIPLTITLLLLAAVTLGLQPAAHSWLISMVMFTFTGIAISGTWPMIVSISAAENTGYSGTVLGTTIAAGAVGYVAAPSIMNLLFARVPAHTVFLFAAIPLLISAGALLLIRPKFRCRTFFN